MVKSVKAVFLILLCFLLSSFSVAVSSEMPLSGLLEPESEGVLDRSSSIAYSGDGNLLAIAYQKEVYLYHALTRAELEISPIVLNDDVRSVEFTSDSSNQGSGYLLVGRDSELTNTPAVSIYSLFNWGHSWVEDGVSVSSIVTIDNELRSSFAYATRSGNNEYIIEYEYSDTDNHLIKIRTGHDSKISCLDYDPINDVFISGSDEKVELHRGSGQLIEEIDEIGMQIFDCKFSKNGDYAWSSEDGVKIRDSSHNFLQSITFQNTISAEKIIFDESEEKISLLTNEGGHSLITYETNNSWDVVDTLSLGHIVYDLDISPMNGDVAASTHSQYVAIYANEWTDPRITDDAINDLDHDGIDDQDDGDRDGDGIPNAYDASCDSTTPCNLVPDGNFIRSVEATANLNEFTIEETIHFTSDFSNSLRILTAEAINENGYIEPEERVFIENAFCSKLDPLKASDTWYSIFSFDNNSLLAGSSSITFNCGGLTNLNHDSNERITLSWSITYELVHEVSNFYNLTINAPPELDYGMPKHLVHDYPIRLKVTGTDIKSYIIETWYDTTTPFELQFLGEVEEPAIEINTLINFLKYASYVLASISFLVISLLLFVRYKNRFKIEDYSSTPKRAPPNSNRTPPASKKKPPQSKRNASKEYEYYNPGRREGDNWNYGDDAGFYYSETYTDYKKASDSLKKTKVRKIKVDPQQTVEEEAPKQNRRRVIRKKNNSSKETQVQPEESQESLEAESKIEEEEVTLPNENIAENEKMEDLMDLMIEKTTDNKSKANTDEEKMMDKALDKFFK